MPRAFDRGIPPVDKNPLISATSWGDPETIIGEAATNAAGQIQGFFFSLFEECVEFLEGLKLLGEDGANPIAQLGLGLQALIDQIYQLLFCGADPGVTPQGLIEALSGILTGLADNVFIQGLVAFAEFLETAVGNFAQDAVQGATDLIGLLCGILTCDPTAGLQALSVAGHSTGLTGTTPFTIISGILDVFTPILANPFIQGIVAFADDIGLAVGNFFLDLYNGILGMVEALCSLVTTGALPESYGSWSNTPAQIVADIAAIVAQLLDNPIINGLRDLITSTGNVLYDSITGALSFLTGLTDLLGEVMAGPQAILDFFADIFGPDGLAGWITSLPFIGPLVAKLTGLTSSGDIALDLATLGTWAQGLLTNTSEIPAANLIGSIPAAILGAIPVSSINFTAGNLLGQGAFSNSNTVEPGGGWAWDSTTTATGTGGSVKATATGSLQQLYSRQAVKVAAGDRVEISAKVKTSGFTSGSMVLAVIPWIGTTAQTAQVIHTRNTAATLFQPMTGLRLRIGGTAEAGEVAISGSVTALTVRLGVTVNSGAVVWFDDVEVKKAGALAQTLVEYLTTTWEQTWNTVFGSGGAGKIWSDFVTAISFVKIDAGLGKSGATTNAGNITGIIDGIGQAIFGDSAYAALPQTTKQSIRKLVGTLFGVSNAVLDEITGDVLPPIDATTLTGDVPVGNLPTDQLFPTSGSGAQLVRTSTEAITCTSGRNPLPVFFENLSRSSTDIQCLTTSGAVGTGARTDYAGAFRVTKAGWYMVEICYRLNVEFGTGGFGVTPVLYKGTTLNTPATGGTLVPFKVGTDVFFAYLGFATLIHKYVQNSFIVYLEANEIVRAGADIAIAGAPSGLGGGASAAENYFSISLLNRTDFT